MKETGLFDSLTEMHQPSCPVTYLGMTFENDNSRLLYDKLIGYYVRKGYTIPIDSQAFQKELAERFFERDGMYFLPEQAAEYDRKKLFSGAPQNLSLFVFDEASAIQWLRQAIKAKSQTFQELHPKFMKEISGWSKNEEGLELSTLLKQNFLCYDGKGSIPPQIVSWMRLSSELRPIIKAEFKVQRIKLSENLELKTENLELNRKATGRWYMPNPNKAGDLEKLREKALLRKFEEYKQHKVLARKLEEILNAATVDRPATSSCGTMLDQRLSNLFHEVMPQKKRSDLILPDEVHRNTPPGNKTAIPVRQSGSLEGIAYSCGTSNAAALMSRAAGICYNSLQQIFAEKATDVDARASI